jgi:TolA-binding protein
MFHATGLTGWQRAAAANAPETQSATVVPMGNVPRGNSEQQSLQAEVEMLQSQLDAMKQRLANLEAGKV